MNVSVRVNGIDREASIAYVSRHDFGFLDEWRQSLGKDRNPIRTDAVDFATLACKRFSLHSPLETYARQFEDISHHIRNDPLCEVANLVTIKCDLFHGSDVIGLAHFRKTWSNNLILDYLAVHLWIAEPPDGYGTIVRGAGTALLYFLSFVARINDCGCIWGETTPNSCEFYQKAFHLESGADLLYIPREKFVKYAENLEQKWHRTSR